MRQSCSKASALPSWAFKTNVHLVVVHRRVPSFKGTKSGVPAFSKPIGCLLSSLTPNGGLGHRNSETRTRAPNRVEPSLGFPNLFF